MLKRKRSSDADDRARARIERNLNRNDTMQVLLKDGTTVTVKGGIGKTPLVRASSSNSLGAVWRLVEDGHNVNVKDDEYGSPLHVACWNICFEIIEVLLENGANVHAKDKYGNTPLHRAARFFYSGVMDPLINHGADINAKNNKGWTLLHEACNEHKCRSGTVEYLISKGANVNISDNEGWTPLLLACFRYDMKLVRYLIKHGAKVDANNSMTRWTMRSECDRGRQQVFQMLLCEFHDLNAKFENGESLLHWVVHNCPLKMGREKSVNRSEQYGRLNLARSLIRYGADLNTKDNDGKTPLHRLCESRKSLEGCLNKKAPYEEYLENMAKLLVDGGADPNAKDNSGNTPLRFACENHCWELAKLLIEKGAQVNIIAESNNDGKAPLHFACEDGRLDMVRLLLDQRANPHTKTTADGSTPLELACAKNHLEVVWYLIHRHPWLISD